MHFRLFSRPRSWLFELDHAISAIPFVLGFHAWNENALLPAWL